jgi:hypothetical protein
MFFFLVGFLDCGGRREQGKPERGQATCEYDSYKKIKMPQMFK